MEATVEQKVTDAPKIHQNLQKVVDQGSHEINKRLDHLSRKWTVGRISKVFLGVLIVLGTVLGQVVSPWWLVLTYLGALCLLQYALFPTSLMEGFFHQFGLRTGSEIAQEKVALKTLRGDFQEVPTIHRIEDGDAISRLEGEGGITVEDNEKIDVKVAIPQVVEASALPVKKM